MIIWASGFVVIAAIVAVSVAGMLLVRRSVGLSVLESHNEVAGFVYAVVGVIYAVLMAFVVIAVWEKYEATETRVEQEAAELADLFRDADAYSEPFRATVQNQIRLYGRAIVGEWGDMARGESSPAADEAEKGLWRAYREIKPQGDYENTWYSESIARLNDLGDYRRLRLMSSRSGLPGAVWALLVIGAAITIAFTYFFGTKNLLAQGLMVGGLATMIGLVLLLTFALSRPFQGNVPVGPDAFEQLDAVFGK